MGTVEIRVALAAALLGALDEVELQARRLERAEGEERVLAAAEMRFAIASLQERVRGLVACDGIPDMEAVRTGTEYPRPSLPQRLALKLISRLVRPWQ